VAACPACPPLVDGEARALRRDRVRLRHARSDDHLRPRHRRVDLSSSSGFTVGAPLLSMWMIRTEPSSSGAAASSNHAVVCRP
jgi:hypothetical protein